LVDVFDGVVVFRNSEVEQPQKNLVK